MIGYDACEGPWITVDHRGSGKENHEGHEEHQEFTKDHRGAEKAAYRQTLMAGQVKLADRDAL